MKEYKNKKRTTVRRRRAVVPHEFASEGSSPIPDGPVGGGSACGHTGCGYTCRVRYVGPTSQIRDHHALHAARGVSHIWAAAIVTGFAVVVSGALAYSSVQAKTDTRLSGNDDLSSVMERLDRIERTLDELKQANNQRTR